ncbi:MAG: hypothetical protein IJY20_04770 [Clostridia bacterium]|nr:hypothetical protein [Clostridia bacterium]
MKILSSETGFSMSTDSVSFIFDSDRLPRQENGHGVLTTAGRIPTPVIQPKDRLLLPIDEGMALTADAVYDQGEGDINRVEAPFYSRPGALCMIIIERNDQFLLIMPHNALHAGYTVWRENGLYQLHMHTKKETQVTYAIFDTLAEACHYYRNSREEEVATLADKIKRNPAVEKLIGGGIFWVWSEHYDEVMYAERDTDLSPLTGDAMLRVADALYRSGVDRAMFGIFFEGDSPMTEPLYTRYNYLTTQYDNYNDVMNPDMLKIIPGNRARNCDYTARRMKDYPHGVQINENGDMYGAWSIKGFDGNMHSQNTLCPAVAVQRIREEVPAILQRFPFYKGRFLDVFGTKLTTCYSKDHPLTEEQCLKAKNDGFRALEEMGLITGTEDGFDGIINHLVYAEGMHSPVYFRNKNSGRQHPHIYDAEQEAHIKRHMIDPTCRVPLWELCYHDAMMAFPYWGDSTDSSHALLRDKILFAVLYGCPPLYSFYAKNFDRLKDDILESYQKISTVHRKVALLPMTDFTALTSDRLIQRSVFGDRYEVVANFSDHAYRHDGFIVGAKDFLFREM